MTQQVIIRDDDTSYFTNPTHLEKIYSPLWEQDYPVALSVIPAHRADVRVKHREGQPYDPCIPPEYRGQAKEFLVTENKILCEYLNQKVKEGLVEICLHGYNHTYLEFTSQDKSLIQQKLREGYDILNEAFPDAKIKTFIAPYDQISKIALDLVFEAGFNLCIASHNFASLPQYQHIGAYQRHIINQRQIFTCDEYLFTRWESPEVCLTNARQRLQSQDLLIIANHYWTFSADWNGDNIDLLTNWTRFVDDLLQDNRDFIPFSR